MSKESETSAGSGHGQWNDAALNAALSRSREPVPPVNFVANIAARVTQETDGHREDGHRELVSSPAQTNSATLNHRHLWMGGMAACFAVGILAISIPASHPQRTTNGDQPAIASVTSPKEAPQAPALPATPIIAPAAPILAVQEPIHPSPSLTIQPDTTSGDKETTTETAEEDTEKVLTPPTPDKALPAPTSDAVGLAEIESDAPSLAQAAPETAPTLIVGHVDDTVDDTGPSRPTKPVYGPPAPSGLGISGGIGNGQNSSNTVRSFPDIPTSGRPQGGQPSGGSPRGPGGGPPPR